MNQHTTIKPTAAPRPWYAIRTRPAMEYVAETEMRRVGLEPYLPQHKREFRHHRSKAWIARSFPLFDGYIFAPGGGEFHWSALAICKGVEREAVLRDVSGKPIPIGDDIIQRIREKEQCGAFDELRMTSGRLKAGDIVKITDGSLAGIEGALSHVRSAKNVRILVSLFNREVEATVSVEKIGKSG
jgi:transcription antitermination factor NusG